ncbi:MAG: type II secretion system F family protein [Armatimonadetes bacterium]|nr:type II secretion system F family protein [Armatimonadota bacterium]
MLIVIFICSFATVCLATVGLTMKGEQALVRDRVEALRLLLEQDIEMVAPELTSPFGERIIRPWLRKVSEVFAGLLPSNAAANIAAKLEQAGNPRKLKPAEMLGLKVLSFFFFTALGLLAGLFLLDESRLIYRVLVLGMGMIVGYTLPEAQLDRAIRERHRQMRRSLADCLDLLVVCAEAGLGLDGALAKVVERMKGPLSEEFRRVLQDMSIGRTRMEALRAMSKRVKMSELTTFVAAIHQADLLGVSIAHVLRVQAESLRMQRNLRAREAAAKLPVKMLFPLVFFIFPAILIVLLTPGVIQIYRALAR